MARAAKAAAIAPRPLQKLRPEVHCQTQRYGSKVRLGKGFSLAELKAAGLTSAYARTVGIAVDFRRVNRSVESLNANVARLNDYKSNLVVFPKRRGVIKSGDASKDETKAVTQFSGIVQPLKKAVSEIVMEDVTDEMTSSVCYTQMRVAQAETKVAGYRVSVLNRKKKD
jgi:large subunit ribosomal protein L13e